MGPASGGFLTGRGKGGAKPAVLRATMWEVEGGGRAAGAGVGTPPVESGYGEGNCLARAAGEQGQQARWC